MGAITHNRSSGTTFWRGARGAFVLCLVGCAHAPVAPETPLPPGVSEAEVRALLAERDRRIRELESRLALLEAEAREVRDRLGAQPQASGLRETVRIGAHVRQQRAQSLQAEGPSRPVLRLHGESASPVKAPRRSHREPLPPLPPPQAERLPLAPLPSASVESLERAPSDPVAAYRAALDLVRQRDFDRALGALSAFLVRYPGDERTADVLFWRGEVQFAMSDFKGALASFHGALEARPGGQRAPEALLKVGLCHRELGDRARARAALERLKSQFPRSRAARLVSQEDAS